MTTTFPYRHSILLLVCATSLILIGGVPTSHAQTVVCMVNGEPITEYDIEQRSKLDFISTHKQPARQDVINELTDEKVKIKEAKKFGVDPSSSDIEQSYAAMSTRMRRLATFAVGASAVCFFFGMTIAVIYKHKLW